MCIQIHADVRGSHHTLPVLVGGSAMRCNVRSSSRQCSRRVVMAMAVGLLANVLHFVRLGNNRLCGCLLALMMFQLIAIIQSHGAARLSVLPASVLCVPPALDLILASWFIKTSAAMRQAYLTLSCDFDMMNRCRYLMGDWRFVTFIQSSNWYWNFLESGKYRIEINYSKIFWLFLLTKKISQLQNSECVTLQCFHYKQSANSVFTMLKKTIMA